MHLSFLAVTIAVIFVLAIVHAPVEATAAADPEAHLNPTQLYNKVKGSLSEYSGDKKITCESVKQTVVSEMCAMLSRYL
ncbi:uncharacterized protein LOC109852901 [Pseudomyrmex gracilis]|uniref:uncharacterized protein LOC109852901 n=1 Tax=Pseudomyrmex gracilis TaxID=219809 RepID=UPI00099542DC|nr:uncharacterized protein LOC109852901 [Pseudomyrmex gracilis]